MIRNTGGQQTLTNALDAATITCNNEMCAAAFAIKSNTGTTAVVLIEWLPQGGGTTWYPIVAYNKNDFSALGGGNITLTDSTNYSIDVPNIQSAYQIRLKLVSIVSGTLTVDGFAFQPTEVDNLIRPVPVTIATSAQTITSTSASALAVGPNGATNPVLKVDDSVSSAATGISIIGRAAAAGVDILVISSGTDENLVINAKGAGTISLNPTGTGNVITTRPVVITSASATAIAVGRLGTTTPGFVVDASTSTCITGLKITPKATGNGVALAAVGEASNGKLNIDAQGSGVLALADTSTGGIGINRGSLQALMCGMTLTSIGTSQSSTPTSAQLLGGIITQTGATGAGTITLPTGTALSTACPRTPATGDTFDCTFVNVGGGQTLTVTGATGTTVVGGATIATAKTAKLTFICTGSNAWSIYTTGG